MMTLIGIAFTVPPPVTSGVGCLLFAFRVNRSLANAFRQGCLFHLLTQEMLYRLKAVDVSIADKSNRFTIAISSGSTTNPMDIVFRIVRHIVVDDSSDIININTTGHDICCDKHIRVPVAKGHYASDRS